MAYAKGHRGQVSVPNSIMPRKSRIQSGTGVYHVMMRGINRHSASLKIQKTTIPSSSASAMHRSSIHPRENVCPIAATTMRIHLCSELVETPLGEHVSCLEYEDERSRSMSDDQVMLYLFEELASVPLSQDFNGRQAVLSIGVFGYS